MTPITIVTGFLGSGKTSLVAHLLDASDGHRIAVVVNDIANQNIDSAFLHGGEHIEQVSNDLIVAISGGLIGTDRRDELTDALLRLAERTSDEPLEAVVVETSGSSSVVEIIKLLENDPKLKAAYRLDTVIAMVDARTVADYWKDDLLRPIIGAQLSAADLIVLNKSDLVGRFALYRRRALIRKVNPHAEVGVAQFGRLPLEEIVVTGRRARVKPPVTPAAAGNVASRGVVAHHFVQRRAFHPKRLDAWMNQPWPGILRVKGFAWLCTDMDHVYVVDMAGQKREIGMEGTWYAALPATEIPKDEAVREAMRGHQFGDRRQSISIIGKPDAVERERRNLMACLLTAGEHDAGPTRWASYEDPIRPRFARAEAAVPRQDER